MCFLRILGYFFVFKVCIADLTLVQKTFIQTYNEQQSLDKPTLKLDTAWLTINVSDNFDIRVYAQSEECWKCADMFITDVLGPGTKTILVNTTFGTRVLLRINLPAAVAEVDVCRFRDKFREGGDYWVFFNYTEYDEGNCTLDIANDPMSAELPILYLICGLLGLGVIYQIVIYIYRRRRDAQTELYLPHGKNMELSFNIPTRDHTVAQDTVTRKKRLKSLDIFRGLSLCIMMFVNYGGGGYWFFDHPPWNGLTVADLVFPWFVFIMGSSMNFSFKSMRRKQKSNLQIVFKIIKRTVILFGLGIMFNTNWGPVHLKTLRIPGVLQRLSLSYLIVALIELCLGKKEDTYRARACAKVRDILLYLPEWIAALSVLAVYLTLTFCLPVPGCPTGYIGPGGLSEGGKYYNCTGGAAQYIDATILGPNHIYQNPTPKLIYQTSIPYDPEGILGTLSAAFLCFLGLQTGRIFVLFQDHKSRLIRLLIWAAITGAIGAGLCGGSKEEGIIPLNKNLWSVSFSLVTAGFANIVLTAMYVVVDILDWWGGQPFIYLGVNPLIAYCLHDIFYRFFPVNWAIENPEHWSLLLKATWDVTIWTVVTYILFRKKIFIAL